MSSEKPNTRRIVVLGASYAGLSAAHYALKHTIPALPNNGADYNVTLISPNDVFFTRPASVRATVSETLLPTERCFYDFQTHFKQYPEGRFTFIQGEATALDYTARSVTIRRRDGETEIIPYHALVIATGTAGPSPLLNLHGDPNLTKQAWKVFHEAVPKAKSIVIGGGGPAGIETAGELGRFLNGKAWWFSSKLENPKCKITVVCADNKILPSLRQALATKAEALLAKVGVNVIKGVKVVSTTPEGAGQEDPMTRDLSKVTTPTKVHLSNGETLDADLYLPAMGVKPNTSFLPKELLTDNGKVDCNKETLRVDKAGPRVYVVGDVGANSRWGILDIFNVVPVAGTNMKRDLLHYASLSSSNGSASDSNDVDTKLDTSKPPGKDMPYKPNTKETQLVPIGRSMGVGAVFGWKLPGFLVWAIKGRDYMLGFAGDIYTGSKWKKETKWSG
jgi:NADH dehydrogenase FAD-containing subunit